MIIDNITNAGLYYALGDGIERALKYLAETDFSKVEPGRYELDGDRCYAMVQDYQPKPREEKEWEAHRKYIDVQFIADGTEMMGYAPTEGLQVTKRYDESRDVVFFSGEGAFLRANKGIFVILYPHDAHMPGVSTTNIEQVRKVVVKVAVK